MLWGHPVGPGKHFLEKKSKQGFKSTRQKVMGTAFVIGRQVAFTVTERQ